MLQESKREEACVYVRTSFDTYSDRHVLGCSMLLCAAVIALLCFAVLAVQRQHTYSYILLLDCSAVKQLLYTGTAVPPAPLDYKEACIGITDICNVDGSTF